MLASERTRFIINRLNANGIINLKEVAKELDISEATVRRDFEKLENEGRLKRVTGGATLAGTSADLSYEAELTMRAKKTLNYEGKLKVAKRASEIVQDGECVFLDGGTSIAAMAEFLSKKHIKIVTHSELVVKGLSNPVAEIFLIGGTYLAHYGMSVGPAAQQTLQQFHFDRVFIGCACVDLQERVAYTNELETMLIKSIASNNGQHVYLLVDSGKLNRRSFCRFESLSHFERVFCDASPSISEYPENFEIV